MKILRWAIMHCTLTQETRRREREGSYFSCACMKNYRWHILTLMFWVSHQWEPYVQWYILCNNIGVSYNPLYSHSRREKGRKREASMRRVIAHVWENSMFKSVWVISWLSSLVFHSNESHKVKDMLRIIILEWAITLSTLYQEARRREREITCAPFICHSHDRQEEQLDSSTWSTTSVWFYTYISYIYCNTKY